MGESQNWTLENHFFVRSFLFFKHKQNLGIALKSFFLCPFSDNVLIRPYFLCKSTMQILGPPLAPRFLQLPAKLS